MIQLFVSVLVTFYKNPIDNLISLYLVSILILTFVPVLIYVIEIHEFGLERVSCEQIQKLLKHCWNGFINGIFVPYYLVLVLYEICCKPLKPSNP